MTATHVAHALRRREPLTVLLDEISGSALAAELRRLGFRVELIETLDDLMKRPYRPRPTNVVLINNLHDESICVVHNLVQRRWHPVITMIDGDDGMHPALTRRELDVLRCLGRGKSVTNVAIGKQLGIKPATVQATITGLKRKLGRRRAGLVPHAYALGLVARQATRGRKRD